MGWLVSWWCDLIGVSDPMSQKVAAGIVAAAVLITIIGGILTALFTFLQALAAGRD
jgi:hypothetical protein